MSGIRAIRRQHQNVADKPFSVIWESTPAPAPWPACTAAPRPCPTATRASWTPPPPRTCSVRSPTPEGAELHDEHRRIDAALAEADGPFLADPTWPRRLIETLDLLRHHILKEQDGVFPAALAYLTTEQWEAVEAVRARTGTRLSSPSP
ncbi:hemerythrin domain-containing protein [Streptomyces sp. NPDC001698]|uniref:hemerythrin domain-containing protein n=1 Tax=Streptomyces sp. NPDC001698 TaxID=3364601 RepID=UPI0036D0C93E